MLDEGRWEEVAAMMLDYYDKLYVNWARQSECLKRIDVDCPSVDAAANAELVLLATERTEAAAEKPEPMVETQNAWVAQGALYEGACYCGEVRVRCRGEARAISLLGASARGQPRSAAYLQRRGAQPLRLLLRPRARHPARREARRCATGLARLLEGPRGRKRRADSEAEALASSPLRRSGHGRT